MIDEALAQEIKVWLLHGRTPQWVRRELLKRGKREEQVETILKSVFGANYREEARPKRSPGRWRWLGVVVLLGGIGLNIHVWVSTNGAVLTSWTSLALLAAGLLILGLPDQLGARLAPGAGKPRRS